MAGDTHGSIGHPQYLVRMAKKEECDRVFVLGDFGYWEHQREGVLFLDRLNEYCEEEKQRAKAAGYNTYVTVYFLDGNHDKTSLLLKKYSERDDEGFIIVREHIRYAGRGHRWTWDDVRFISLGGAYSVDKAWRLDLEARYPGKYGGPESLWFPEEEMTDQDMVDILQNTEPVDVMLAHDKPRGSVPGWNRKDLSECWPNQNRLQLAVRTLEPKVFLHGHLHYYYQQTMDYGNLNDEQRQVEVLGLNCDPDGADPKGYSKSSSWAVVDTKDLKAGKLW